VLEDLDDEDERDDDDDDDDDVEKQTDHHASVVANLLVEAGSFGSRSEALHHVLRTPAGQGLLARLRKAVYQTKESNMDTLTSIMKDGGITKTCAAVIAKGSTSFSEFQIVEAATAVAADRHPDLSPAQAFAKIFSASTDEARVLREAINVAKQPTVISGADLRDADDADQAMDALREIGRRMAPTATAEKQFAVAFGDPKNAALALRAHRRPAATTFYPYPR
jgi:hypothetical protein